jgi:hypothetical protein
MKIYDTKTIDVGVNGKLRAVNLGQLFRLISDGKTPALSRQSHTAKNWSCAVLLGSSKGRFSSPNLLDKPAKSKYLPFVEKIALTFLTGVTG